MNVPGYSTKTRILGYTLLTLAMMTVGSTVIASKIIAGALPLLISAQK